MALSQIQIIRSLGDALAWLEKELQWGVQSGELRHLTGRIGELYVAMRTRGQMALEVNQRGYDVVSAEGEQISVKTITSSQHVTFNKNTFDCVHRVMVLRINFGDGGPVKEEDGLSIEKEDGIYIEELVDMKAADFLSICKESEGTYRYVPRRKGEHVPLAQQQIVKQVSYNSYEIVAYESGTIQVKKDGVPEKIAKPILRKVALALGINIVNDNGNDKNTRQLGSDVITAIQALDTP